MTVTIIENGLKYLTDKKTINYFKNLKKKIIIENILKNLQNI